MPDYPGTFIVLEGVDGSGKTTQFNLLAERLKAAGYDVEVFDFPRYDQPSSYFVRSYLNGDYGPASQISPYSASMFYALDRFEAAPAIRKALEAGIIVLSNRYVGSNMAHQGSKFTNEAEQRGFFIWADSLEYQLLGIPRPTLNIFLRVPAEISFELVAKKAKRDYTNKKRDQHEADIDHLKRSVDTYDILCRLFPKDFHAIHCAENGKILSIPIISNLIWQTIKPLIPANPPHSGRSTVVKLDSQLAQPAKEPNEAQTSKATDAIRIRLSLLALIEAAKSGRLENRGNELVPELLGDGSEYYTPEKLEPELLNQYQTGMKQLATLKKQLQKQALSKKVPRLAEILALATPMSATVPTSLEPADAAAISAETDLGELRNMGYSSKVNAVKDNLNQSLLQKISSVNSVDLQPITLLEALPRNEFEILGDSLYGSSDLPSYEVQAGIDAWSYDQKYQALTQLLKELDTSTAKQVRYRWDVIAEQSLLLELIRSGLAQNLQTQPATPRYGYDVPEFIEQAGLDEIFIECFDKSLELYSVLQSSKNPNAAAYATLAGHKMRFQFTCSLEGLTKVNSDASPALNDFRQLLTDKISETHPLIAEHLSTKPVPSPKDTATSRPTRAKRPRRRRSK